jgi:hypothetical protein
MNTIKKKPAAVAKILSTAKKTKQPLLKAAAARSGQWQDYPLIWNGSGFTGYNTGIKYDPNLGLMVITLNFQRNAAITAGNDILQLPAPVSIMGYTISTSGHLFYINWSTNWIKCISNISANTRIYATTLVVPY